MRCFCEKKSWNTLICKSLKNISLHNSCKTGYAGFFLAYGVQIIDLWKRVENDRNFLKFPLFYCNIKILCHGYKKTILKTASNLVISLFSHMDLKNNFEH